MATFFLIYLQNSVVKNYVTSIRHSQLNEFLPHFTLAVIYLKIVDRELTNSNMYQKHI